MSVNSIWDLGFGIWDCGVGILRKVPAKNANHAKRRNLLSRLFRVIRGHFLCCRSFLSHFPQLSELCNETSAVQLDGSVAYGCGSPFSRKVEVRGAFRLEPFGTQTHLYCKIYQLIDGIGDQVTRRAVSPAVIDKPVYVNRHPFQSIRLAAAASPVSIAPSIKPCQSAMCSPAKRTLPCGRARMGRIPNHCPGL